MKLFDSILSFDSMLFKKIYTYNGRKKVDKFFYVLTRLADGSFYILFCCAVLLVDTKNRLVIIPVFLIGLCFEYLVYKLMKNSIKRARPYQRIKGIRFLIKPPDEFSFPSGHTAIAVMFAAVCSYFYPFLLAPVAVYAFLVAISRVYNGVHYPGDTLVGAMLGFFSAKIALYLVFLFV